MSNTISRLEAVFQQRIAISMALLFGALMNFAVVSRWGAIGLRIAATVLSRKK